MTEYIEPYIPNLVPQGDDVAEVQRFLADELQRIAVSIRGASVAAAYGGLLVTVPNIGNTTPAPRIIFEFDDVTPAVPNRMESNPPTLDFITPLESGVYFVFAQFSVGVAQLILYRMTLQLDGVLTNVFGEWQTGVQQDAITMVFGGMVEITPGQEAQISVISDQLAAFNIQNGIFMLFRISEVHEVRT